MDTTQISCTLKEVRSFLGVYRSDMLPRSVMRLGTVIINADPHTEKGSHWLALHLRPKSSSAYYFDSYGIVPLVPAILAFIKRNCITWDHKRCQLQSLTSNNSGKYCCLFVLYMDRGFTPKQFVGLFDCRAQQAADRCIDLAFASEFGWLSSQSSRSGQGGQCSSSIL